MSEIKNISLPCGFMTGICLMQNVVQKFSEHCADIIAHVTCQKYQHHPDTQLYVSLTVLIPVFSFLDYLVDLHFYRSHSCSV